MLRAAALVSAALAGVIRGIHHGKKVVAISGRLSKFCFRKWHKNFQLMVLLGNLTRKWLTLSNKWLKTWLVRVLKFNFEPVLTVPPRVPLLLLLNTKQPHNYLKDSLKKNTENLFELGFDWTASLCELIFRLIVRLMSEGGFICSKIVKFRLRESYIRQYVSCPRVATKLIRENWPWLRNQDWQLLEPDQLVV